MGIFDGVLLASDFDNTLIYTEDALRTGTPVPPLSERNRAAARLQESRRWRRENKDTAQYYKCVVEFFHEKGNRNTLNQMRQLLGRQRKEEEYLGSSRTYYPRVEKAS